MSLSKSLRFEVFKRDSFTCQYCGRSAPDVVLNVDHIHPVAEGGTDDIMNLITSCFDCNNGKSDRLLSDDTVVKKRKAQMDTLQERREQLEMLMEWQRSLMSFEDQIVNELHKFWCELCPGYMLTDAGIGNLRRWQKRFGLTEVTEAMRISADQYLEFDYTQEPPHKPLPESVQKAFNYIPRICTMRRVEKDNPVLKELYYIRGILRKRLNYVNEWKSIEMLKEAVAAGQSIDDLKELAKTVKNWTQFVAAIEAIVNGGDDDSE